MAMKNNVAESALGLFFTLGRKIFVCDVIELRWCRFEVVLSKYLHYDVVELLWDRLEVL